MIVPIHSDIQGSTDYFRCAFFSVMDFGTFLEKTMRTPPPPPLPPSKCDKTPLGP